MARLIDMAELDELKGVENILFVHRAVFVRWTRVLVLDRYLKEIVCSLRI